MIWEKKTDGNQEGEEMKKREKGRKGFFQRESKSIVDISAQNNCGRNRMQTEPGSFTVLCSQL